MFDIKLAAQRLDFQPSTQPKKKKKRKRKKGKSGIKMKNQIK